jgi:hypothetical protein
MGGSIPERASPSVRYDAGAGMAEVPNGHGRGPLEANTQREWRPSRSDFRLPAVGDADGMAV